MVIEFVTQPQFNFLTTFAEALHVPVINNELQIPTSLGEGFVRRVDINAGFRLLIHRYKLNQELVLRRIGSKDPASIISVMFYNNEDLATLVADDQYEQQFSRYNDMAIQIASNNLDSIITFPAHKEIYYTVVGITIPNLESMLEINKPDPLIEAIINPKGSFLFYESMSAETQITLK
jgi:hypothetical protein